MKYKVKYGGQKGKTLKLEESPDKVVIRTKNNQDLNNVSLGEESRELLDESVEVASFPEAGVTVRRMRADNESAATSMRDQTRVALNEEQNIRFAGRVLQDADSGAVMLYTENFFVKFFDDIAEKDCIDLLQRHALTIKNQLPFAKNAYFVQAAEGTGLAIFDIAEAVLQEKAVEFCHPELVQERRFKGIHPLQWHLKKTNINGKTIEAHVNIESAWSHTRGKGAVIAIIDDGIDTDHPEFQGRVIHPYDATRGNDNPKPQDDRDNHGTACAGMACAAGLNDGASGTAPEASLMPIRLSSGLGSMAETKAFVWAADHGADVISCSWGPSDGEWWNPDDPLHQRSAPLPDSTRMAMEYALTKGRGGKGCVILFAAGNGNEDTVNDGYSSYPGVIAVTACNDSGRRSVYSDFGQAVWAAFPSGDYGWKAYKHPSPATEGLRTTDRLDAAGYAPGDYVNSFGGTSGACPGMAGIAALMIAANPQLRGTEVKELIRQACDRIDIAGGEYNLDGHSIWYGHGRINAGNAVQLALTQPANPVLEGSFSFSNRKN
ncbi:MAG: S8 family serine peptidase [Lewinellaceae bacterium]|nr:S8 family serine peptidase [Lewinellaceae bacterium]